MENTENIKAYSFIELLPILLAFSQSMQLCNRALADDRLTAIHPDVPEAVSRINDNIRDLIDLLSNEAFAN